MQNLCGTFADIGKLINEIVDRVANQGYILYEDLNLFDEKQTNCIRELGELLDRLDEYE